MPPPLAQRALRSTYSARAGIGDVRRLSKLERFGSPGKCINRIDLIRKTAQPAAKHSGQTTRLTLMTENSLGAAIFLEHGIQPGGQRRQLVPQLFGSSKNRVRQTG